MTEDQLSSTRPDHLPKGIRSLLRRERWPRGAGPSWPVLVSIAAVLIVGILGLLVAGIAGVSDGLAHRRSQKATAVSEHYTRGVSYLDNNELVLAEAELARVLELAPDHLAARSRLEALTTAIEATAKPSPTVMPSPTSMPTATTTPQPTDAGPLIVLLQEAQNLMQERQWSEASLRLEQLRAIAPEFESPLVVDLLYQCNMNQAQDLVADSHLEAALRSLDRALELHPNDPDALEERTLLVLYSQGVGIMGADWEAAIFALGQLHERKPDYLDVAQKLFEAHSEYAAVLIRREEWCVASYHLQAALALSEDQVLADQLEQARSSCQ